MPTHSTSSSTPPALLPVYVIDRTDIVRVFAEVPEREAKYVHAGTKATVLVPAYRTLPIPATVVRTSWALNTKTRMLRVEIDLPNPGSQLLPGMHADVEITIEHPAVRAVPLSAIFQDGNRSFCWMYDHGHAVRTELETGASDGQWVEVLNHRIATPEGASQTQASWTPLNGSEQVILSSLSLLTDGTPVKLAAAPVKVEVSGGTPFRHSTKRSSSTGSRFADDHGAASFSSEDHVGDHGTTDADVGLDELQVELALETVNVADAGVQATEARLKEVQATLARNQADVERWNSEETRLKREIDRGELDPQVLTESRNQWKSSTAALEHARAEIATAKAELRLKKATLAQAKVAAKLAQATLQKGDKSNYRYLNKGDKSN